MVGVLAVAVVWYLHGRQQHAAIRSSGPRLLMKPQLMPRQDSPRHTHRCSLQAPCPAPWTHPSHPPSPNRAALLQPCDTWWAQLDVTEKVHGHDNRQLRIHHITAGSPKSCDRVNSMHTPFHRPANRRPRARAWLLDHRPPAPWPPPLPPPHLQHSTAPGRHTLDQEAQPGAAVAAGTPGQTPPAPRWHPLSNGCCWSL
jgi:hypothetical protein